MLKFELYIDYIHEFGALLHLDVTVVYDVGAVSSNFLMYVPSMRCELIKRVLY